MWLRRIYRFLVSLMLGIILLLMVAFTFVHYYQDEIISLFVQHANQYINTPVKTKKISVSLFSRFPQVAIAFEDVWIKEGFVGSERPLATAKRIYCTFSILDLLRENYRIQEIHLEDAEVYLRVKPSGEVNYQVMDKKEESTSSTGSLSFDLQGIQLDKVLVEYQDQRNEQLHKVFAKGARAHLQIEDPVYSIQLDGQLFTHEITTGTQSYLKDQHVELDTRFNYHAENELLHFEPSELFVGSSSFLLKGTVGTSDDIPLDLTVDAGKTDFQSLIAILPPEYTKHIRAYRSKGDLTLQGTVIGKSGGEHMPAINLDFSASQASFFHPEYGQAIENVHLSGRYTNGDAHANSTSLLEINNLQASLNQKPITGTLLLKNFDDYHLSFNTKSVLDAKSFLRFYPLPNVREAEGVLDVRLEFAGRLKDLEKGKTIQNVKASGEIVVQDLGFQLVNTTYPIHQLNGSLIFNNNDLALSNLSGMAGKSSFVLNGLFKNIFSYLLLDNQPITIEADLKSGNLDLDELLTDANADPGKGNADDHYYSFDIRPDMNLYFNCHVDKLKFDRFRAKNVSGELTVANGVATVKKGSLEAAGGQMAIEGTVNAREQDLVSVNVQAGFKNIHVDSTFWIFKNFNQTFLTDRNLNGRVTAGVNSQMQFDKKLRFDYDRLIINADASIVAGQLKDFEPMQNLSSFINEERLSNISFLEITSNIQVRNQTIYLPETIIRSDISTVTIKGTHTFNQHIDYHVKVPVQTLITGRRRNLPVRTVRADDASGAHLLLKISGTTDDYKISYDTEAVKEKIVEDVQEEKKELKEAIKNKTARNREAVELDEEEYFDW